MIKIVGKTYNFCRSIYRSSNPQFFIFYAPQSSSCAKVLWGNISSGISFSLLWKMCLNCLSWNSVSSSKWCGKTWVYVSKVIPILLCPSQAETFLMSALCSKKFVAQECLNECILWCSMPASSSLLLTKSLNVVSQIK